MKALRSLFFIFLFGLSMANAQTKNSFFLDIPFNNQDTVFENVLSLLFSSDYFVLSADKGAGLIQCKIVKDNSKVFTSLKVDVLEYNLLIRENLNKGTRISIQANLYQKSRSVSVNNDGVYMDDVGVTNKSKYYEPLISFLKSNLD